MDSSVDWTQPRKESVSVKMSIENFQTKMPREKRKKEREKEQNIKERLLGIIGISEGEERSRRNI